MRLLLDTHVWLWSLGTPARLNATATDAIGDDSNDVWLSPISVWECAHLIERGRITVELPAETWLRSALTASSLHEAELTHEVVLRSRAIRLEHKDPADRFLAATAAIYDLVLVTADRGLLRGRGYETMKAA